MAGVLPNDAAADRYCLLLSKEAVIIKNNSKDIIYITFLLITEKFSANVPRSPVRELLEMEPETAKFR